MEEGFPPPTSSDNLNNSLSMGCFLFVLKLLPFIKLLSLTSVIIKTNSLSAGISTQPLVFAAFALFGHHSSLGLSCCLVWCRSPVFVVCPLFPLGFFDQTCSKRDCTCFGPSTHIPRHPHKGRREVGGE